MRLPVIILLLSMTGANAHAQQSSIATYPPVVVTAAGHDSAVQLVELMGARQQMLNHTDDIVNAGKSAISRDHGDYNPAFIEEWGRRMKVRLHVDDFVAVMVRVYENHFNNDQLRELIQVQRDVNSSKTPNMSPELKQKVIAENATIQSEILGGCSQVGAKLGGEVGQEIVNEHPEWTRPTASTPAAPKN